jgi:hypothetical protein
MIYPPFSEKETGSERVSDMSRITQSMKRRVRVSTQACLTPTALMATTGHLPGRVGGKE